MFRRGKTITNSAKLKFSVRNDNNFNFFKRRILLIMNFKKVILIFVLLFSFTWAVNSNDPRNDDEINPENELLSSSDESDDGKFLILCYKL